MIDIKDANFPKKTKELLNQLSTKEISMQDFLKECAYWGLQFLEEYRYRPLPTKPQELLDFEARRKLNPHSEMSSEFWRLPAVSYYVEQARQIEGLNIGNRENLKRILQDLPEDDLISREKVKEVLKEHDFNLRSEGREEISKEDKKWIEKDFLGETL